MRGLTIHSSRRRFAARLNSGVMTLLSISFTQPSNSPPANGFVTHKCHPHASSLNLPLQQHRLGQRKVFRVRYFEILGTATHQQGLQT
jgi:hypothetical protein